MLANPFRSQLPIARLTGRALLATCLACVASIAQPAISSAEVEVLAEARPGAPSKLQLEALAPRSSERVTFYIDGKRRWVDESPEWQFGPSGYLDARRMMPGEHLVTTEVVDSTARVTAATRTVFLKRGRRGRGARWQTRGSSKAVPTTPVPTAPAPGPESTPEPAADPASPSLASTPPSASSPTPPGPASVPTPPTPPALLTEAGFENGFAGLSMAGAGDVQPTIATDVARTGTKSAKVVLTGSQDRSEMIVADSRDDIVSFTEGQERYYAFSFLVKSMQYGRPGAHNLITQLKSDGEGSPAFGLALWDFEGERGLWSHGAAAGGDRFLAPIAHDAWNDVVVHFRASRTGQGFYEVYLNGQLIDSRQGVSMIRPDRTSAYLKTGLYRNGGQIPGTSELRFDSVRLGTTAAQVTP